MSDKTTRTAFFVHHRGPLHKVVNGVFFVVPQGKRIFSSRSPTWQNQGIGQDIIFYKSDCILTSVVTRFCFIVLQAVVCW